MPNAFLDILKRGAEKVSSATRDIPVPTIPKSPPPDNSDEALKKKAKFANSPAGLAVNTVASIPEATVSVFKSILQGIARSGGMVGLTAYNNSGRYFAEDKTPIKELPQTKFSKILFGEKPLRDIPGAVDETKKFLEPYIGKTGSKYSAAPLVIGSIFMDLTGFGGGKVKLGEEIPNIFLKRLAREQSPDVLETTLKKVGLDESNSKALARELAPTKSVDEVKDVLANYGKNAEGATNRFSNILKAPEEASVRTPAPRADVSAPESAIVPTPAPRATPDSIPTPSGPISAFASEAKQYPTIHAGGEVKMVDGEPVKIIDGVDTFVHKGDNGYVVSESSTGRFLADSASKDGAIAKAKFNIDNIGQEKFLKLIEENRLPLSTKTEPTKAPAELPANSPEISSKLAVPKELEGLAKEVQKYDTPEEFANAVYSNVGKGLSDPMTLAKFKELYKYKSITEESKALQQFFKENKNTQQVILKKPDLSSPALEPLAIEARKYDTPQQFLDAIYGNMNKGFPSEALDAFNKIYNPTSKETERKAIMQFFKDVNDQSPNNSNNLGRGKASDQSSPVATERSTQSKTPEQSLQEALSQSSKETNPDPSLEKSKDISYARSITDIIENARDSKYAFLNYTGEEALDEMVKTKIPKEIFDEIKERAKEGNFMFKPVSSFLLNTRDPFRNFEAFFNKNWPEYKETFFDPLDTSKGKYVDLTKELAKELHDEIVVKLGIKKGSKESAAVMDYGERDLKEEFAPANPETKFSLTDKFGAEKADKIVQADAFFRKKYNDLIDAINVERKKIYGDVWSKKKDMDSEIELLQDNIKKKSDEMKGKENKDTLAYNKLQNQLGRLKDRLSARRELLASDLWWRGKVIGKRDDYYRHYFELAEGFKALKNILTTDANIPTNLAGITNATKPKAKFLQFAQKRTGNKSERDAVGSFLNYIPSASYAINIDPHIEGLRKLADSIRSSENKAYSPFIEFLTDYANDLAGKTNEIDRGVQKVTGRKVFQVINWINNRVKANTILGNVSSSLAQIFNVPQGIASAKAYSLKGAARSFGQILQKNPAMEKSTFIKERFAGSITDQFDTSLLNKPRQFAIWMLGALDEVGTKFIWNSHYEKALGNKIPNPIKYADDVTRKLVAGRGIGEVPLIQKSKIFQMIAPFQLEVGNSWWVLKDFVKKKDFSALVLFFVTSFVMNQVAEEARGNDVVFDPIEATIEGVDAFKQEENKFKGGLKFAGRLAGEVVSNIPLGQSLASMYPENGYGEGDWTLSREELFGKGDPTRFGSGLLVMKGLQDPLFKVLPSFGGAQIKKTIEGTKSIVNDGEYDKNGNLQFEAPKTFLGKVKAVLFGKYATTNAQNYFEAPTIKAAEIVKIKPIYDQVQSLVKEGKEEEAKTITMGMPPEQYALYKKYKTVQKTKETNEGKIKITPTYNKVQELVNTGRMDEAKAITSAMTPDEYKYYQLVKKQRATLGKPGSEQTKAERNLVQLFGAYAKAFTIDPSNAWEALTTKEKLGKVEGNLVGFERFYGKEYNKKGGSEEYVYKLLEEMGIPKSERKNYNLEHIVPLDAGGDNSEDNLKIVDRATHNAWTEFDIALGKAIKAKKITRKEAETISNAYKSGEASREEVATMME